MRERVVLPEYVPTQATDTVHACDDIVHECVMLTDFGLCHRLTGAVVYKELKKRAGDGTLCYNTIDAHKGAECTYRGDVEILAYCLCEWLAGPLPWKAAGTNDSVLVCVCSRVRKRVHMYRVIK